MNSGFLKYFKNTTWLAGAQFFRLLMGVIVTVALARYLGPEDFGLYNFILSIVIIINVGVSLGMHNSLKRAMVTEDDEKNEILGAYFSLSAVTGSVLYIALIVTVMFFFDDVVTVGLFSLLGTTLLITPFRCIDVWFQAKVKGKYSFMASTISSVAFGLAKLAAIYFEADLIVFGYIFAIEGIALGSLLVSIFVFRYGSILNWEFRPRISLQYLKKSWPLLLSGIAIVLYARMDQVMLKLLVSNSAVGEYSAAVRISSVFYIIPSILATSLFPAIVNGSRSSSELYYIRISNYFKLSALLALIVSVSVFLFSKSLVDELFGAQYAASSAILAIHIWCCTFVFLGGAREQVLVNEKKFKISLYCTLLGFISNLGLNLLLIPRFAGEGAAIATLVSFGLASVISSFFFKSTLHLGIIQIQALFTPWRIKLEPAYTELKNECN